MEKDQDILLMMDKLRNVVSQAMLEALKAMPLVCAIGVLEETKLAMHSVHYDQFLQDTKGK